MCPSSGLGRALVAVAGIWLAQPWALAGAQTKPAKPVAAKPASRSPGCGKPFVMPDQSFRALEDVRDASLWVDDIDSGLFGGFDAFDVYVVTGRLYAPFQLKQGKLGGHNFRRYTANNYNTVTQGPLTITAQRPRGDLAFTQDGRTFTLKVTGVQPSTFGRDTITVQLCW